ncbi:MAG: hypothetical protein ABJL73_01585 [Lentilitoribacter sp.]
MRISSHYPNRIATDRARGSIGYIPMNCTVRIQTATQRKEWQLQSKIITAPERRAVHAV